MSTEEQLNALGCRITNLRLKKGWFQNELADKCGWDGSRQCGYEAGGNPTYESLVKLSEQLDTPVSVLTQKDENWREMLAENKRLDEELRKKRKEERKSPWKKKRRRSM
jgi:transcriptional regulator with XRE-family HTH domain